MPQKNYKKFFPGFPPLILSSFSRFNGPILRGTLEKSSKKAGEAGLSGLTEALCQNFFLKKGGSILRKRVYSP